MESPEWDEWRKAEETEMLGMADCVYKQVARPKDKLVVGTKMLYKRKIRQDGKVEKYKCQLVEQGFWQVGGVHYTEKYSPTPATASSRMLLAMAAAKDGELRHFDAEQAFLKADIDEEIYIDIPEEFQEFPGAVGRLNKAIYGLLQAGRCWNNKFCDDMTAIGFEQEKTDPCVFRKVVDGEAEMVVVVDVDDIIVHAKDQATMDIFAAELGQKFKLKCWRRGRSAGTLKDARSDSIVYLGGRVRCFIRGGKGSSIFETSAGVHGTVDEGQCSECV